MLTPDLRGELPGSSSASRNSLTERMAHPQHLIRHPQAGHVIDLKACCTAPQARE